MSAGRWLLAAGGALLALLLLSQLILPSLIEGEIEDRLTERGGSAEADVSAVPAARLLFGDGSEIQVRGEGMDFEIDAEPSDVFERLDGFGEVDVELTEITVGPLAIESFELARADGDLYTMQARATTTLEGLIEFGSSQLGLLGALFGDDLLGAASEAIDPQRQIPLAMDMTLESSNGEVQVVSGGSTLFGIPTGPLGSLVAEAVVSRL